MKNKIIAISLLLNLIAVGFILYSFIPKPIDVDDSNAKYISLNLDWSAGKMYVCDGQNIYDEKEISMMANPKKRIAQNQDLINELNRLSSKGYEVVQYCAYVNPQDRWLLRKK